MKDTIKLSIITALILATLSACLWSPAMLRNWGNALAEQKAQAIRAEGEKAVLVAEAQILSQAALSVEADRLTAHEGLYKEPSLLPWVVAAGLFLILVVLALVVIGYNAQLAELQRQIEEMKE